MALANIPVRRRLRQGYDTVESQPVVGWVALLARRVDDGVGRLEQSRGRGRSDLVSVLDARLLGEALCLDVTRALAELALFAVGWTTDGRDNSNVAGVYVAVFGLVSGDGV
jgi:hypothetical protein